MSKSARKKACNTMQCDRPQYTCDLCTSETSPSCIHMRGEPPKKSLFIKYCVFILTCLNFSRLQSALHLMQYTYQNIFSTAHFLNSSILLSCSVSARCFPSEDFFHPGKQKHVVGSETG